MPEPKLRLEPHPPKRSSGYLVEVAYKSVNQVNRVNQPASSGPTPIPRTTSSSFFLLTFALLSAGRSDRTGAQTAFSSLFPLFRMGTASSMTRPTSTPLSTMSGNFDFPPASSSSSSTSAASIDNGSLPRPLLQLRQALQRDRERDRAARDSAANDRQNIHVEVPMPPRRHRGDLRRHRPAAGSRDSRDRNTSARLPLPVPASSGYRPRATPGDRFQNLRRHRLQREQTTNDMAAIDEASHRLAELDSDLTSLLMPGSISLSGPSRRTPPGELDGPRRRVKRRKLEHENVTQNFEGFKYGHFGQVVPGRLKMEMVSCDGGEYSEDSALALYRPENVLKNDKSVYCTKNSRCNILLKHQGETTFCLEKVVIKAPERGFTAP